MDQNPLITIITSTFNAANDLEKSIQSVISQSYSKIEYIIIDGGSTDGTLDIIKKYESHIDVWITEKDEGIYDAWNKGLSFATGDWIAFLGADDAYLHDAIYNYVNQINKHNGPNLEYISSKVELVTASYKPIRIIGKPWNWHKFKRYMCTAHVGSLHAKSYFERYGNFNMNFKIVGDYELLLRAKDKLKSSFLSCVTVRMKIGGISNSSSSVFKETFEAKVKTDARNIYMARLDLVEAKIKIVLRSFFIG